MRFNFWKNLKLGNKKSSKKVELPKKLKDILLFKPNNPQLFKEAFIPRSAQKKKATGESVNYERLEFLGDAMLGSVIAKFLFDEAPEEKEGYLTQMRSKIVSRKHLNEIGNDLNLVSFIDKEIRSSQALSNHISGDLFEALIGAVYEDQGFEKTKDFIYRVVINPYVDIKKMEKRISSYKSYVLEWSQKNKVHLEFNTFEEKNAEDVTIFVSVVRINDTIVAKGRGTSKKKAEENAAKRTFYAKQNEMT